MKEEKGKLETKISNLNYNERRIYELAKADTKLIVNTLGHGFVAAGVINLALAAGSALLVLAGGVIVVKTIMHAATTNKEIINTKKLYKNTKYHR